MKKRVLSLLLAVAMVASMVVMPVSAQAQDNVTALSETLPLRLRAASVPGGVETL